jgi:hypothetical protein
MSVQFHCPVCQELLTVASCQASTRTACPVCAEPLAIPGATELAPLAPSMNGATPGETPVEPGRIERRAQQSVVLTSVLAAAVALAIGIPLTVLAMKSGAKAPSADQAKVQELPTPTNEAIPPLASAMARADDNTSTTLLTTDKAAELLGSPALAPADAGTEINRLVALQDPGPAKPPAAEKPAAAARTPAPADGDGGAAGVRKRWANKRRSRLTDEDLRRQLLLAPEVDLEAAPGAVKQVITLSGKATRRGIDVVPQVVSGRPDLLGLPLQTGALARKSPEESLNLMVLSQRLRLAIQAAIPGLAGNVIDPRPDPELLRRGLLNNPAQSATWLRPQAITTLRQLLMPEHRNVRLILVELLSKIDGPLASQILAERAVFDIDEDVRLAAVLALRSRPVPEFEPALIAGLRYPWPAMADHAAEALVALNLRDAAPKLMTLLDARDQNEPYPTMFGSTRQAAVPELVRVNHLKNCLLCHSYSASPGDPVRGLVPNAEHPVPTPTGGLRLQTKGWGGGGGSTSTPTVNVPTSTFVRADITFFRQDFSVTQPVPNHGKFWPADQRFDYLVRLRPLSGASLSTWQDKLGELRPAAPQRESLLFALRELTGEDAGPSAQDWIRRYSTFTGERLETPLRPAELIPYLRDSLVAGSPAQQAARLAAFREKSGPGYNTALAQAIPKLSPELQKNGRTQLAERMYCLPIKTLATSLNDPNQELRRAGIVVSRQRKLKTLTPELIEMLDDTNPDIARQVHQVLQHFAARDLGPKPGADRDARLQAMQAWRDWWEQHNQKQIARKGASS